MKAAVIHGLGDTPRYEDFPDPQLGEGDVRVVVKSVILDYALKLLASGNHFASRQFFPGFPAVVGHAGVGELEDGSLVSFQGVRPPYGSMAEIVVVPKGAVAPIPSGVDVSQAAVLPSAALSSLLPLRHGAQLQPGETVMVNGATSVSGMLAVQIARYLGAGKVVGTGRNARSGERVRELGVDAFISLNQSDDQVSAALHREAEDGYDIILDYLWGHPADVILSTFTPTRIGFARKRTRYVVIGVLAGREVRLSAESIITSGLEIRGFGVPNTPSTLKLMAEGNAQVWEMIKQGVLQMEVTRVPLKEIASAWSLEEHGKRILIEP